MLTADVSSLTESPTVTASGESPDSLAGPAGFLLLSCRLDWRAGPQYYTKLTFPH